MSDYDLERAQNRYKDSVLAVAAGLREVAQQVDRLAEPSPNVGDTYPDYMEAAQDVMHAVIWGTANLHLHRVVRRASSAADAVREATP